MQVQFQFSPEEAKDDSFIRSAISNELKLPIDSFAYKWHKRSIDARKREIKINASFEVFPDGILPSFEAEFNPQKVGPDSKVVHIVGAGLPDFTPA